MVQQNSFKSATDTLSVDCPETEEYNPKTGSSAIDNMQYVYWFHQLILRLLGTFAKLWKVTVHVCQLVHMEQLGSHWAYCHETLYFSIFQKSVMKIHM